MRKLFIYAVTIFILQVTLSANNTHFVTSTHSDAGVINQLVSTLSDQLTQNKNFTNFKSAKIAITSFVCLDDLKATSRLSNILSENLIHEMQIRGYQVIDFKTMDNIKIDARGDFPDFLTFHLIETKSS